MNTKLDRLQELEWQAQERALRAEREPVEAPSTEARVAEYRLVARALRQPMPDLLPADFARRLAARVGHVPLDTRLERWLVRSLVAALAVSGLVAVWVYGPDWWQAVLGNMPQASVATINWICVAAACMGGSWLLDRLRQQVAQAHGVHA